MKSDKFDDAMMTASSASSIESKNMISSIQDYLDDHS
jgi:hypothetical protein